MTSGLILSTNFTDTTKHRRCFLGASSADLKQTNKQTNKQTKKHQGVRKSLIHQNKSSLAPWESNNWYWACWPIQPQNERDGRSQRWRNKLQLHKHFCHFCRHPNNQEQCNNSRKRSMENCSTIKSFTIYHLWYPPVYTARPFTAYFSGFSWHWKNTGNDSHKADPERSSSTYTYKGNPSLTSEEWLPLILSTEAWLPSSMQSRDKRYWVYVKVFSLLQTIILHSDDYRSLSSDSDSY